MPLEQIILSLTKHFFSPCGKEYRIDSDSFLALDLNFVHHHLFQPEQNNFEINQTKPKRYKTPLEDLPNLPEPPKFEWANLGKYIYGVTLVALGQIKLNESIKGTYEAIKTWVHEKMHLIDPLLEEYVIRAREAAIFLSEKTKEKYGKLVPEY